MGGNTREQGQKSPFSVRFIAYLLLAALLPMFLFLPSAAFADAGGFAGSSDYGSSDWGSSDWGSSDWGSSDWGSSSWDWDDDDDDYSGGWLWGDDDDDNYGSSSYHSYYNSDYRIEDDDAITTALGGLLVLGMFGFMIFIIYKIVSNAFPSNRNRTQYPPRQATLGNANPPAGASRTDANQLLGFGKLQQRDPAFHPNQVEEMVSNVYVRLQHAWTAKDIEPVRPYFSNRLFSQFSNQLKQLVDSGRTNYVDNIAVLECRARGWYEDAGGEHIIMKVRTRITDYTVEEATGRIVSGYRDRESYMEYEYTLTRSSGSKTGVQTEKLQADACPNCGAPINLEQNAKCEFCGTVTEAKDYDWVISEIKGVSQRIV